MGTPSSCVPKCSAYSHSACVLLQTFKACLTSIIFLLDRWHHKHFFGPCSQDLFVHITLCPDSNFTIGSQNLQGTEALPVMYVCIQTLLADQLIQVALTCCRAPRPAWGGTASPWGALMRPQLWWTSGCSCCSSAPT